MSWNKFFVLKFQKLRRSGQQYDLVEETPGPLCNKKKKVNFGLHL